ncbi:MAG: hypothetical protein ACAH95_08630 [Fimbriimonas sp.]
MVWVEGKAPGVKGPTFEPFGFEPDWEEGDGNIYRVRHLIAKLVRESVREFQLREREGAFRILTPEKIVEGLLKGKIGKAREETQKVDLEQATGQALQAFEDGLYLLFVNEEEKRSLEEPVSLMPDTRIVVVRLTALAGR